MHPISKQRFIRHRWVPVLGVLAGVAAAATAVSPASAVECLLRFPTIDGVCASGSSRAVVQHFLSLELGEFQLSIDMTGGSSFAVAYGADEEGVLDDIGFMVGDLNQLSGQVAPVPASLVLRGGPGDELPSSLSYDNPFDMTDTFIFVL